MNPIGQNIPVISLHLEGTSYHSSRREVRPSKRLYAGGGSCCRICGAHGEHETAGVRDVRRAGMGRGLRGGGQEK